jgi:hypothetical protein
MSRIIHYIKANDTVYDLEEHFEGLLYSKCTGLYDKGKRKDIYVEKFVEEEKEKVWFGSEVKHEPTKLKMSLYFTGENRHKVYDDFYNTIKNGVCEYWDTKRLKKAFFYLENAYAPNTDSYNGSTPYIECNFELNNMYGQCFDCNENGE